VVSGVAALLDLLDEDRLVAARGHGCVALTLFAGKLRRAR
jgi:hypothetical protein